MKTQLLRFALGTFVILSLGLVQESQAHRRVNLTVFHSALAPYGEWFEYRDYGLCWRPTVVEIGWRPYTHGRWIWTGYGWTWHSYYEWGWAPFHYGRWVYDDYYGWIWVPDEVWGPAWVQWRYSDAFIGWAPLPPGAYFQIGIGISFGSYNVPHFAWSFTRCRGFLGSTLVFVPVRRNVVLLRETRIIHGITYHDRKIFNRGPGVDYVERAARTRVRKATVVEDRNFGSRRGNRFEGERLHIYRPDVDRLREVEGRENRVDRRVRRESERESRGRDRREERFGKAEERDHRSDHTFEPRRERRIEGEKRTETRREPRGQVQRERRERERTDRQSRSR